MFNYIYEMIAFVAAVVMYFRGDYKCMALWLAATVLFGICGTACDIFFKYSHKEVRNG